VGKELGVTAAVVVATYAVGAVVGEGLELNRAISLVLVPLARPRSGLFGDLQKREFVDGLSGRALDTRFPSDEGWQPDEISKHATARADVILKGEHLAGPSVEGELVTWFGDLLYDGREAENPDVATAEAAGGVYEWLREVGSSKLVQAWHKARQEVWLGRASASRELDPYVHGAVIQKATSCPVCFPEPKDRDRA
jgi:hypothetical protein